MAIARAMTVFEAKDAQLRSVSQRATGTLKKFGISAARTAKTAAVAFVAAAVAISGAMLRFVQAYAEQEKQERLLDSALKLTGASVAVYGKGLRELASEIQETTIYGDEFVLGLMRQGLNLGITAREIGGTTKKAIGLATALGIDLKTSMRMTALATQGEFMMLRRYIPELRATTDATKQLDIVNRVALSGWKQSQEEADTLSGKVKQLGNTWGDLKEKIAELTVATKLPEFLDDFKWGIMEITRWMDEWTGATKRAIETQQELRKELPQAAAIRAYTKQEIEAGKKRAATLKKGGELIRSEMDAFARLTMSAKEYAGYQVRSLSLAEHHAQTLLGWKLSVIDTKKEQEKADEKEREATEKLGGEKQRLAENQAEIDAANAEFRKKKEEEAAQAPIKAAEERLRLAEESLETEKEREHVARWEGLKGLHKRIQAAAVSVRADPAVRAAVDTARESLQAARKQYEETRGIREELRNLRAFLVDLETGLPLVGAYGGG